MKKSILILLVCASLGFGVGTADAYITSTGTGTAAAQTASLRDVTIDATAQDPSESLLPGSIADATFAVDNPNQVAMTLVSVAQDGPISVTSSSGCTLADSGVTFTNQTGLSIPIPADVTDYGVDLPTAMSMASTSSNTCQNATFAVPITITVHLG